MQISFYKEIHEIYEDTETFRFNEPMFTCVFAPLQEILPVNWSYCIHSFIHLYFIREQVFVISEAHVLAVI